MKHQSNFTPDLQAAYDADLKALDAAKDRWARTSLDDRKVPISWGRNGRRGPMPSCPAATV